MSGEKIISIFGLQEFANGLDEKNGSLRNIGCLGRYCSTGEHVPVDASRKSTVVPDWIRETAFKNTEKL